MSLARRSARTVVYTLVLACVTIPLTASRADAATTVTSYSFVSAPGDWVGGGASSSYGPPGASFTLSGTAGSLSFGVTTSGENWTVNLAAPAGAQLHPGSYTRAERAAFRSGSRPGLDVYGDGRGCNRVFGSFFINSIEANSTGQIVELDATFTQQCEASSAPPLNGVVKYQAPGAAPVVLTSSNLSSVQRQPITLAASIASGSGGTPTGSVTFFDGTRQVGRATVNAAGQALVTTGALKVGARTITAVYSGDGSHSPATSSAITQQVRSRTTAYWFKSGARDYIGAGGTASYVPADGSVNVTGVANGFNLNVSAGNENWTALAAAPAGQNLQAGTTYQTRRFQDATYGRLDVSGDGRGCNQTFGTLTINAVGFDGSGNMTLLDATFVQECESPTAPRLVGSITLNVPA
ncbi:MAG: hypothetical protein QOI95_4066 [Acidimicrobiaceae bacterium]|jgi:hypothetical protein